MSGEVAGELARYQGPLWLDGLRELTPEVAEALSCFNPQCTYDRLSLGGLRRLSPEVAKKLAPLRATLSLGGLRTVSPELAEALVKVKRPAPSARRPRAVDGRRRHPAFSAGGGPDEVRVVRGDGPYGRMLAGCSIALLADIPDGKCRDGGPEHVIRREDAVVAMPVLPRWRHEIGEPVEELKRCEFYDAIGSRPRGHPARPSWPPCVAGARSGHD